MKKFSTTAFAILLLVASGCSTMFNSGSQTVSVVGSSGEEGVNVEVKTPDGVYRSKLPATVVTSPSTFNPTEIKVVDKCYDNLTIQINRSIAPSFYANIFNYCLGCIIDPLTGAMWKLNNHTIVPLTKRDVCRK
jgi:hypothetical protein